MSLQSAFKRCCQCRPKAVTSCAYAPSNTALTARLRTATPSLHVTFRRQQSTTSTSPHSSTNATDQSNTTIRDRVEHAQHTYIPLTDYYSVIKLTGSDALKFLQGLCTNDMRLLTDTHNGSTKHTSIYTAFLNTKGRWLFDAFITQAVNATATDTPTYYIEVNKQNVDIALSHFKMFNLRQKLTIEHLDNITVHTVMSNDPSQYGETLKQLIDNTPGLISAYIDPRLSDMGIRVLQQSSNNTQLLNSTTAPPAVYNTYRYINGLPHDTSELQYGKSMPLECNLDLLNGVSFNKGCYLGQELTNRTHSSGVIRKRLYPVFVMHVDSNQGSVQQIRDKLYGKQLSTIDTNDTAAQMLLYNALTPLKQPLTVSETTVMAVRRNGGDSSDKTVAKGCVLLSINNKIAMALLRNEYIVNNTEYDLIATLSDGQRYYIVPLIPSYMHDPTKPNEHSNNS